MAGNLCTLLIALFAGTVLATTTPQEYDLVWEKKAAASSAGGGVAVDQATGNVYSTSTSWTTAGTGSKSVVVTSRSSAGTVLWTKSHSKASATLTSSLFVSGGHVYLAGNTLDASSSTQNAFVMCLNAVDGTQLWEKTHSGAKVEAIALSNDGATLYSTGAHTVSGVLRSFVRMMSTTTATTASTFTIGTATFSAHTVAVDTAGRVVVAGGNTNGTAVTATTAAYAMAFTVTSAGATKAWELNVLPSWTGLASVHSISVISTSKTLVLSGTAFNRNSPLVFYSTVQPSTGALLSHTAGQYGTVIGLETLDDAAGQGLDGPYIAGQEQHGRYFVYKYSARMHKIDRFVFPAPGTAVPLPVSLTDSALYVTTSGGRQSAQAIYIAGTQTASTGSVAILRKLLLVDNCNAGQCSVPQGHCIDFINSSVCQCQPGYAGLDCSVNVDECASSPCLNQATCQDLVNMYNCTCRPGFHGDRCQSATNDCQSSPCMNGNCRDTPSGYSCVCQTGWTGQRCDASVDDCARVSCGPGQCIDGNQSYACKCPAGYKGTHCEVNIDECASNPCTNNGVCVDKVNAFQCQCPVGTHAPICQDLDDACARTPCANGGICTDLINDFKCTCATGYTGRRCEAFVDTCKSNNCSSGSTCQNVKGKYYNCLCQPGMAGKFCSVDVDECASSPCKNGATCQDLIAHFKCKCPATHNGILCDTKIPSTTVAPVITTESKDFPNIIDVGNADQVADLILDKLTVDELSPSVINEVADHIADLLSLRGASAASQDKALQAVDSVLTASPDALRSSKDGAKNISVALEGFGGTYLHGKPDGNSFSKPMENIAISAKKVSRQSFTGIRMGVYRHSGGKGKLMLANTSATHHAPSRPAGSGDELADITVPRELLNTNNPSVVNLVLYDDDKLFVRKTVPDSESIVSPVVALNVSGIDHAHLAEDVVFTLRHDACAINVTCEHRCVHWNYEKRMWSSEGCRKIFSNVTSTKCSCEHLTNFAILASYSPTMDEHTETLSIISLACGILSMIGLGLTCIVIALFKKLRGMSAMKITFCFSFCMFCSLLFLLVGAESTGSNTTCHAMAILMHFFVLATMCWSLVMAINLYRNLVTIFSRKSKNIMNYYHLIGWGIPSCMVLITILAEFAGHQDVYVSKHYCWFKSSSWYFGTFIAEMGAIWLVNIVVFILVLRTLNRKSISKYDVKKGRAQTKINLTIFNQLSIVWVFAFVALASTGTTARIFEYLFAIATTLQGLGVFVLCVVLNREIRNTVRETAISTGLLSTSSSSGGSSSLGKTRSTSAGASRFSRMSRFSRTSLASLNKPFSSLSRKDSQRSNGSSKSGESASNGSVVLGNDSLRRNSSLNRKDSFGTSTLGRHNEHEETMMMAGNAAITNPHFKQAPDSTSESSSVASA
ncbi:adhesion G protein-coupled receptor E2-like [Sycon ciliatum]|uniref:adhesion G protein-coupled receptor E2-like n=1 Tax=Sycon ciliatum TaxID=27933 RepID=UPI0031F686CF